MKDRFTAILAIILLSTLIGVSYWYSLQAKKALTVHLSDLEAPDFRSIDSVITRFTDEGKAKDKLFAENVEHYSDGHATAKKPRYFSLDVGKPQVSASSDTAHMTPGGEVFHFNGNVKLVQAAHGSEPENRLETSQLDAYPDTEEYKSDAPVSMYRGSDSSHGIGMDYDNIERTFKLRSRVQTTLQPTTAKRLNRNE